MMLSLYQLLKKTTDFSPTNSFAKSRAVNLVAQVTDDLHKLACTHP